MGKLELSELSEKAADSESMAAMDVKELLDALLAENHAGAITARHVFDNMRVNEQMLAELHRFVRVK